MKNLGQLTQLVELWCQGDQRLPPRGPRDSNTGTFSSIITTSNPALSPQKQCCKFPRDLRKQCRQNLFSTPGESMSLYFL